MTNPFLPPTHGVPLSRKDDITSDQLMMVVCSMMLAESAGLVTREDVITAMSGSEDLYKSLRSLFLTMGTRNVHETGDGLAFEKAIRKVIKNESKH